MYSNRITSAHRTGLNLLQAFSFPGLDLDSNRMEWLNNVISPGGKLFGIEWHFWKVVGWLGNVVFFSRFLVQWYATEKRKQVVVPAAFWWLSLFGAGLLLAYSIWRRDSVFIFAYLFTWIPYGRNLLIHYRHVSAQVPCLDCNTVCPPRARFCFNCGRELKKSNNDPTTAQ